MTALLHWRTTAVGGGGAGMMPRRSRLVPTVPSSAFNGFGFPPEFIALAVRWYLRYGLSSGTSKSLLDEVQPPRLAWDVHGQRSLVALESADLTTYRDGRRRARALLDRVPLASARWVEIFHDATDVMLRGEMFAAEARAEAALQFGLEIGQPDAFAVYGVQLTSIRMHQGRWEEWIPVMEQVLAERPAFASYRPALACSHARTGDGAVADELLDEFADSGYVALPMDAGWTAGMAAWAEAAFLRGRRVCETLRAAVLPFADQLVTTQITIQPSVAHYLGRLDHLAQRYDEAEAWFAQALRIAEGMESPLLVAYTHSAWAELAADRGDAARARELAEAALAPAVARGYGYIERDAREVLDRIG